MVFFHKRSNQFIYYLYPLLVILLFTKSNSKLGHKYILKEYERDFFYYYTFIIDIH